MLKARIDLLKGELDLLKPKEPPGCSMEVLRREVTDAKSDINNLFNGLRRDAFVSYASLGHSVDQSLLAEGHSLRGLISREAKKL